MNKRMFRFSVSLSAFLVTTTNIGLAQDESNSQSTSVPRSAWAVLDGDRVFVNEGNDFPVRFQLTKLNGRNLTDGKRARTKDKGIECLLSDCRLKPGPHQIDVNYHWSALTTKKERSRQESVHGLVAVTSVLGGPGGFGMSTNSYRDNPCEASLEFEAQARQEYAVRVIHTDPQEPPEDIRVFNVESGLVVATAVPSCQMIYRAAKPFSRQPAPDDQCVIHFFVSKDDRASNVLFKLDGLGLYCMTSALTGQI